MRSSILLLAAFALVGTVVHFGTAQERFPVFGTNTTAKKQVQAEPVSQSSGLSAADVFGTQGGKAVRHTPVKSEAKPTPKMATDDPFATKPNVTIQSATPRKRDYYSELYGAPAQQQEPVVTPWKSQSNALVVQPTSNVVPQETALPADTSAFEVRNELYRRQTESNKPTLRLQPASAEYVRPYDNSSQPAPETEVNPFDTIGNNMPVNAVPETKLNTASQLPPTKTTEDVEYGDFFQNTPAKNELALPDMEQNAKVSPNVTFANQSNETANIQIPTAQQGPQTASVQLSWVRKTELNINQKCTLELHVKNVGKSTARNVMVDASIPQTVKLIDAAPAPAVAAAQLQWALGTLAGGESKTISISMIPTVAGDLGASAQVHFTGAATDTFSVKEPKLELAVAGTQQATIGEPAMQSITISNPGTGVTRNIQIEAAIPEGLEHREGNNLSMDVGSLNPGETRTIRLALATMTGGQHKISIAAVADNQLSAKSESTIEVFAPALNASIAGPALRYKGRSAKYTLTVSNPGNVVTNNVRLMHKIPDGMKFVSSNRGANYDSQSQVLSWFVGRLDSGKSANLEVVLTADEFGDHTHYVRATSELGTVADAKLKTKVDGVPSLVLDIADIDDPVEVGVETAYIVTVKNEGSRKATNVGITCELPNGIQFLSAKGPAGSATKGEYVIFEPIAELKPGESSKFQIKFKGLAEGSLRMRVQLSSDSSPDPLTYEELTRFYDGGR